MSKNKENSALVAAMVSLGQSLRQVVVAEGVEEACQLEFLRACGCNEVQGFLVAKPLPPKKFMTYIRNRSNNRTSSPALNPSSLAPMAAATQQTHYCKKTKFKTFQQTG